MKINGTLKYKIKETHPDIGCIEDWNKDKVYSFSDTYTFDEEYEEEKCIEYAMHDLMLVAGGGYSTKDIEVVEFIFRRELKHHFIINPNMTLKDFFKLEDNLV